MHLEIEPQSKAPRLVGQMVDVMLTERLAHSLRGEVVACESALA